MHGGSAGSGGTTSTGGTTGSGGVSGEGNCNDERRAIRELINENKTCSDTSECEAYYFGCGVTEDGCTGAVYVNRFLERALLEYHQLRLQGCVAEHESIGVCAECDRVATPPTCSDGTCIGASACALEIAALQDFKSRNDSCNVDDDCVAQVVGCEVTEDDCTGAVYYAKSFDLTEFSLLRDEYYACAGACSSCFRTPSPPACVLGHCQIRPFR
jgi:hypothetical protein